MTVRITWLSLGAAIALGCARPPTTASDERDELAVEEPGVDAPFRDREALLLAMLGDGDTRFYARMHPRPEDVTSEHEARSASAAWDYHGYWDCFDRTRRQMRVSEVQGRLTEHLREADLAGRRTQALSEWDQHLTGLRWMLIDATVLDRITAEERARLEAESELPRGALTMVPAIVTTWPTKMYAGLSTDEMDTSISWRLSEVRASLRPGCFSEAERDSLRTDVSRLSRLASGRPRVVAEAAQLDDALARLWTAPYATTDDAAVASDVRRLVDWRFELDAALPALGKCREALDVAVDAALDVLDPIHRAMVMDRARDRLLSPARCAPRLPLRSVRDLAPPEERALSCSLVQSLAQPRDELDEVASLLALRDATALAAWAIDLHGELRDPAHTQRALLRIWFEQDAIAALASDTSARPVRWIAAGLAARMLLDRGLASAKDRARAWISFGEAPLDVIREWLATGGDAPR